ncbi:histone lysine demethylase no66, partial [Cystoisospora suis]
SGVACEAPYVPYPPSRFSSSSSPPHPTIDNEEEEESEEEEDEDKEGEEEEDNERSLACGRRTLRRPTGEALARDQEKEKREKIDQEATLGVQKDRKDVKKSRVRNSTKKKKDNRDKREDRQEQEGDGDSTHNKSHDGSSSSSSAKREEEEGRDRETPNEGVTFPNYRDVLSCVSRYLEGFSLVINQADRTHRGLYELCRHLADVYFTHVFAVSYLTPPYSQAVQIHTDDQDVILIQLWGSKCWKIYEPPQRLALNEEMLGKRTPYTQVLLFFFLSSSSSAFLLRFFFTSHKTCLYKYV